MTTEGADTYLRRLQRELRTHGVLSRRITDEARDHLLDAIDDGMRRGLSQEAAEREALTRFGSTDDIGAEFGRVYRWSYAFWYLAKIAASIVASVAAALAIEVIVNLRVELQAEALRLAPGFGRMAMMAVAIVLGLATAWEVGRRPFELPRAAIAMGTYAAACIAAPLLFAQGMEAFGSATLVVLVGYGASRLERRPVRLAATFAVFALSLFAIHRLVHIAIDPIRTAIASGVLLAIWISTLTILSRGDRMFSDVFAPQE